MPIHDWTRVDAGLFHDFHQDWTIELRRSLNAGRLPPGYVALADQQTGGGVTMAATPPRARFVADPRLSLFSSRYSSPPKRRKIASISSARSSVPDCGASTTVPPWPRPSYHGSALA